MAAARQAGEQDGEQDQDGDQDGERVGGMEQDLAGFQTRVGKRIKRLRESCRLTQEELAVRVGFTSHALIAQIETGSRVPTLHKAMRLAQQLGVSLDELVGGTDSPAEESSGSRVPIMHVYGNSVVVGGGVTVEQVKQLIQEALKEVV